jgi:transcription elongation factor GreA
MLDEIVGRAVVIDPDQTGEGVAGTGATVLIEDLASGGEHRYRLTGAHALDSDAISAASPMGQALIGALPGDVVTLDLPNGRSRSVRLLAVEAAAGGNQPGAAVKVPTSAP